jgi:hypothetical protein
MHAAFGRLVSVTLVCPERPTVLCKAISADTLEIRSDETPPAVAPDTLVPGGASHPATISSDVHENMYLALFIFAMVNSPRIAVAT